ncbi:MAG: hypothetical protein FJ295_00245 [Planctomycetes bacterium]|nr:hypothetical protein [Planctomycetota bacterium]
MMIGVWSCVWIGAVCPTAIGDEAPRVLLALADQLQDTELDAVHRQGYFSVAIPLTQRDGEGRHVQKSAAERVAGSRLELAYWIEIGRCVELADSNPRWMASLQGHSEWRRLFPRFPKPGDDEIVKNYPWVPIGYQEAFDAHRERVRQLLEGLPPPRTIYLNDLQAAPSACGCGHSLCRWTTDYGPLRTATRLDDRAAARFVNAIQEMVPAARVVPVLATECEQADKEEVCGGVGCFDGICWRAFSKQLAPLAEVSPTIGVLALYRLFDRDRPRYGPPAGWVGHALESLQSMPPIRDGEAVPAKRLAAVVQGWDVSEEQLRAQVEQANRLGVRQVVVARAPIDQSWEPRIIPRNGP